MSKTYEPHIVVVWPTEKTVAAQEFAYKEDAEQKYEEVVQLHVKAVLAKVIKAHGEG